MTLPDPFLQSIRYLCLRAGLCENVTVAVPVYRGGGRETTNNYTTTEPHSVVLGDRALEGLSSVSRKLVIRLLPAAPSGFSHGSVLLLKCQNQSYQQ